MREIKFKGKRADNGDWVIGSLVMVCDGESLRRYPCIVISFNHDAFDWHEVIPETVAQLTGAYDAGNNGKEVFEGDIIQNCDNDLFQEVYYDEDRYAWYCRYIYDRRRLVSLRESLGNLNKVFGNIHDNLELIK